MWIENRMLVIMVNCGISVCEYWFVGMVKNEVSIGVVN